MSEKKYYQMNKLYIQRILYILVTVPAQSCLFLCHPWTASSRLLCSCNSQGKNIGVSCHFLLQAIFSIQ